MKKNKLSPSIFAVLGILNTSSLNGYAADELKDFEMTLSSPTEEASPTTSEMSPPEASTIAAPEMTTSVVPPTTPATDVSVATPTSSTPTASTPDSTFTGGDVSNNDGLEVIDPSDRLLLQPNNENVTGQQKNDELKELNDDLKDLETTPVANDNDKILDTKQKELTSKAVTVVNEDSKQKIEIFDVGQAEKTLLDMSKKFEGKISNQEWQDISKGDKSEYTIQESEWLWKISQKLFGSGFFYSKIWSLNPYITNPHEVKPGMVLTFKTGNEDELPSVAVDGFETPLSQDVKVSNSSTFGDDISTPWIDERRRLVEQGVFFQFASDNTYEDLEELKKKNMNDEWEKYSPPEIKITKKDNAENYDETGFDKGSILKNNYREGFSTHTFVSTNPIQDIGYIKHAQGNNISQMLEDFVYIDFDESLSIRPGEKYSIYSFDGKVKHDKSDRTGNRYTILGQVEVVKKTDKNLWECRVFEQSAAIERSARVTIYTPKIKKLTKTFSSKAIEAMIVHEFRNNTEGISYGEIIYLDRGRADGVEMGNIFEIYSKSDEATGKKISNNPVYKVAELSVITLTDNFSTAIVTNSSSPIEVGYVASTKTKEQAMLTDKLAKMKNAKLATTPDGQLDELEVELNLSKTEEDLLKKADQVKVSEDEMEELDRQEREKSIIKDHEKDLKELERLEKEIKDAESNLNEAKIDEDKYLEQQNLNDVEGKNKSLDTNAFDSISDLEKEIGKKYMDDNLNSKDNPYGLTEYDIEEVDELINLHSGPAVKEGPRSDVETNELTE